MPSVSVIIPCFHDEVRLTHLLKQLHKRPNHPLEIIVVDGANSRKCREICDQYQVSWLASEPCRGRQLLAGAALAQSDVLWFLHADARLPTDPLAAMTAAFEQGAVGGYFRFRFDAPRSWTTLALEFAIALRCRFGGVPYGDQGLFISRQTYIQVGSHAPWPLFEEVPLVRGARYMGKFLPLSESIFVDSRRWQRDGWWRRTWNNRKLALGFACGITPHDLASLYHSRDISKITKTHL
ncbi:MAG TPA: TIGR04283 family arsenosugar biosynthesis glycosyltransferase [Nitrosomonas sp.]|nr:TIGR04283 family arsenosugar biosynthesis glycosyltransferase [Nitrosomonas sp.]HMW20101.1 TIGR04283 family arsenosugar biosynthesis glycosyltransferase [Nitrosomonas sp.]HMW69559.1 TIGR04283 family arsenosugar biosynthesis glycosyltransferase [Nitrosomonas sp.]HNM00707.1 TIGR04283 family arsenosugar biosynthesis glycosyltransferase [Nitrosomonas sp.]